MRVPALLLLAVALARAGSSPEELFHQAVAAQEGGDDATALARYREILKIHPEAVELRVNVGSVLAHMGRVDDAIAEYRAVLDKDAGNTGARVNLVLAYRQKNDLKQAVVEARRLLAEAKTDPRIAMLLADCYLAAEQYVEAAALFEKVGTAESLLLAGKARLQIAQYDLALADADGVAKVDPNTAGLLTLRGMILEHTGDLPRAEEALRRALLVDSNDFEARLYLGSILLFNRNLPEASAHLSKAIALQPQSAEALYQLALLERREGKLIDAVRDLQAAVELTKSKWLPPHVELARLQYQLNRPVEGERERAIVDELSKQEQISKSSSAEPLPLLLR